MPSFRLTGSARPSFTRISRFAVSIDTPGLITTACDKGANSKPILRSKANAGPIIRVMMAA